MAPKAAIRPRPPIELSSFVGRAREIAEARSLLPRCRLLSLVGPAGCGKTRLALQIAAKVSGEFADGVCFAELAGITEAGLVEETTAMALGIRPEVGRPLQDVLLDALSAQHVLLVLDNCEHLAQDCARMSESLLRRSPKLTILTTSREPLRLAGEIVSRVPPLECPPADHDLPIEGLARVEAIALLLERVRARQPTFALTSGNACHIAEICRRLDGMPLAIELAAARLPALGAEQLASRLDDALPLLSGGNRNIERQETLKATLDWSNALLSPGEQAILRQLSVFVGGFDIAAAEAVCAADGDERALVMRIVADLAEKSLISVVSSEGAGRYRLLEMVRQYAGALLGLSDEADATRRRFALHYLTLTEKAEQGLKGSSASNWLNLLAREHDNLRAALSWLEQTGETVAALRMAAALHQYLVVRGYHLEGRQRLTGVLALPGNEGGSKARAKVLMALGELMIEEADYRASRDVFSEALAIFEAAGDSGGMAYALWYLGRVTRRSGDNPGSRLPFERSVELFRLDGEKRGLAGALMTLGDCLSNLGETSLARPVLQESLELFRQVGGAGALASVAWVFGNLACTEGNYAEARSLFSEALQTGRTLSDKSLIAQALEGFAGLASMERQPRRAFQLAASAAALRTATGAPLPPQWQNELEQRLQQAYMLLSNAERSAALAEGASLPLDAVVDYALQAMPAVHAKGSLTAREREVASLVARGLTNRQVAEALVISPETAAVHVKRIFSKLALHSRTQLAAWVVTEAALTKT